MHRYGLSTNYLQLKNKDQNKGSMLYIDGRPKIPGNIAGFINSTQAGSTLKKPNCIFEVHEGNRTHVETSLLKGCALQAWVAFT